MSERDEQEVGETIDRRTTADGHEVALVKRGGEFEIIYNGQFLMASSCRRSERSLAELALAPIGDRRDITVVVGGLGMGHTLAAALAMPGVVRVDVVEISEAVVEWNRSHFTELNGDPLRDPRVHLHVCDLADFAAEPAASLPPARDTGGWLAMLLDVDNGPDWPSRPRNRSLYTEEGLELLQRVLRPGGVLAVWSADRDIEFLGRLHATMQNVAELAVPVEIGTTNSLDYIYRARRPPRPGPTALPPGVARS